MKRVLVVGSSGSGKSTVSRALGEITGLPVVHCDLLYWSPGWIAATDAEFDAKLDDVLARDGWIIDGNYSRTFERRLTRADTIVFLDIPRIVCAWRVLKRHGKKRPDLPEGCPERRLSLDYIEFIRWIWGYPRRSRPRMVAAMHSVSQSKTVHHLRGRRDVDRFLSRLRREASS